MRVKLISGEVREIPIHGAMAGLPVVEATLTVKDVPALMQPHAGEWLAEVLSLRLMPEQHIESEDGQDLSDCGFAARPKVDINRDPYDGKGHTRMCSWFTSKGAKPCDCTGRPPLEPMSHA